MMLIYQGSLDDRTSSEQFAWSFKDKKVFVLGFEMIQGSNPSKALLTFIYVSSNFPSIRSIKTCFKTELKERCFGKRAICYGLWRTSLLLRSRLKSVFSKVYLVLPWSFKKCTVSSLEALKIVFVKAYSKNVWLNSWLRLRPCCLLPFLPLVYVWPT